MSSGRGEFVQAWFCVGQVGAVDDVGEASLEGAQGLGLSVAAGATALEEHARAGVVVGLGDGYAVESGVELAVAGAAEPAAFAVAGPDGQSERCRCGRRRHAETGTRPRRPRSYRARRAHGQRAFRVRAARHRAARGRAARCLTAPIDSTPGVAGSTLAAPSSSRKEEAIPARPGSAPVTAPWKTSLRCSRTSRPARSMLSRPRLRSARTAGA